MNNHTKIKFLSLGTLIGLVFGYSLACFLVSVNWSIDVNSGALRQDLALPPFKVTKKKYDRAFPIIFPNPDEKEELWVEIGEDKLPVVFFGKNRYTKGDIVLSNQRILLEVFTNSELSKKEREAIAKTYFSKINEGKFGEASDYVMTIWEEKFAPNSEK